MPELCVARCTRPFSSLSLFNHESERVQVELDGDGKEIAEWVAGLTELVSLFEERVEMLLQACDSIDNQLKILSQIEYNHEKFLSVVQTIQIGRKDRPQQSVWRAANTKSC